MGRDVLAVLLASTLWVHSGLSAKAQTVAAAAASQASGSQKPTLKEQVIQIPPGAQVEVRLLSKERLRGRLGDISDEGFIVQIAQDDRIETRKVAFGEVKSVKQIRNRAKYVFLGVVMTFMLLMVVGYLIEAHRVSPTGVP